MKTGIKKTKKKFSIYEILAAIVFAGILIYLFFPNLLKKNEVAEEYMFKKNGELTFLDSTNTSKAKIDIEIADNDFNRQLGLMFRKKMGITQGMLFIFPAEEIQSFWMRNTNISLDMIFVNSENKIVTIHKNTTPQSDQSYRSTQPAKYVIEVDAGFTNQYKINDGDKINWTRTK